MMNIKWRNCIGPDVGCQTNLNLKNENTGTDKLLNIQGFTNIKAANQPTKTIKLTHLKKTMYTLHQWTYKHSIEDKRYIFVHE